jgi:threonine dehydrogenase-like Zn-dependent dehydrogenase
VRAIRHDGNTVILDARWAARVAAAGEAVVRPVLSGVSDEDAEAVRSRGVGPGASVLGSEFVGVVEGVEAGAEERRAWLGRRVTASPVISCGSCDLCRAGLAWHCRSRLVLGRLGAEGWDGCLAERVRVPLSNLVAVPDGVSDEAAVLCLPAASAAHAARLVRADGAGHVTVLGDTVAGLLTAQVLSRVNPAVRLLGSDPARLALCEKWGGVKHRPLSEVGRRRDQAVVVECTGTSSGLEAALRLVRPRGKVVLTRSVSGELGSAVSGEVELIGASSSPAHEGVSLLARGGVDTRGLITGRFRLDDGVRAVHAASEAGQLKVVVEVR